MDDLKNAFFPKHASSIEMFPNENYLNESQDKEFRRIAITSMKKSRDFKKVHIHKHIHMHTHIHTHMQLNVIKEKVFKKNKYLSDAQESTNLKWIEMTKTNLGFENEIQ